MPATPARIGFITNEYRRAIAGPDASVQAKYGELARDNEEPVETFFDTVADAQAMADERLALLSPDRRLLAHEVAGVDEALALVHQPTVPTAAVIDDERGYAANALIATIEIDLEQGRSEFRTWG